MASLIFTAGGRNKSSAERTTLSANIGASITLPTIPNLLPRSAQNQPAAVDVPDGLYSGSGVAASDASLSPQEVYDGGYSNATEMYLRIATGGSGQSGLIKAWADAFIKYNVENGLAPPFKVGWYLGDTTESLGLIEAEAVDLAVTYNEAAEKQSLKSGASVKRVYGFRDHFMLVGPLENPAALSAENDDVLTMFNKIVARGNADVVKPPSDRPPVRFLSRFDKSATNIKDSELFIKIGQVPWGLPYSKWYHQYTQYPLQALNAAALLKEYTITDKGTWFSSPADVNAKLTVFKIGSDEQVDGHDDELLNPAHVMLSKNPGHRDVAERFMEWVVSKDGGQKVIREFKKNGEVLYSEAPDTE
ncbi:hypothetical protein CC1G_09458 [Coprinopsis cinerea okayama7|uniref:PBP domain-containing protein n=1 Tax=Coprinopsis cinerea (strain Okayama-7 / 130 / ATCC MYA-4618 / FGSC 9003) TaxID=240176 RepID=A8PDC6_COPC7|nr:hypothetical protein CC1G_09458 [Coprinopsis cinerea okayama7\|eukprot:XP_001840574.1 hypothetical protein CC1G_09458 [Coprinopsis cinerea okayama7\